MTNKTWRKWTDKELELLKIHWKSSDMRTLLSTFPNRTYNSLMLKAQQLGVKSRAERKRKGTLEFLDNPTTESCYWWGFIMADGHLSPRGELVISLKSTDVAHLEKLADYLKCDVSIRETINSYTDTKYEMCMLRIQDKRFGNRWLKLLNINSPKTYTAPNLSLFIKKKYFLDFFIGMIDGDGCIWITEGWNKKPWPNIRIELHKNWKQTLDLFSEKLFEFYSIESSVKMTKRDTVKLEINKWESVKTLKNSIKTKDFLERKWSKLAFMSQ